jgi:hypothetical protein
METLNYDRDSNLQFDSKAYLRRYDNPTEPLGIQVQFLDCWHSFYQAHGKDLDPTKAEMLEFGGGPTIWSLFSAAPNVSRITFSDFAETNRREIDMWRKGEPGCHNWRPYIDYVVETLEGNMASNAASRREQDIRSKLQEIVYCDVRAQKPLYPIEKKFDVIHTNLCLEIVCETKEEFCEAFGKFRQYLKPKGYLLCVAALGGSWYLCWNRGSTKWHQLCLSYEDLDHAMSSSGFTIIHTRTIHPVIENDMSATKRWQFIVARNDNLE